MQVSQWKKEVLERLPEVFATKAPPGAAEAAQKEAQLYQKIGQLEMELEWLKKNLRVSTAEKRTMIEPEHPRLSVSRQCELLDLPRATHYHRAEPVLSKNLQFMKLIDEIYMQHPFYGSRLVSSTLLLYFQP